MVASLREMSKYFDLATAIFALIAAGFWWASAGKLPPMRTYWMRFRRPTRIGSL